MSFAPLPEGALLHDGRYVITETRDTSERSNVYIVEGTTPARTCPNCQVKTTNPDERFCSLCGADLSKTEPVHLRYRMREKADKQAFAVEAQLLEKRLEHPGLLLPIDVFTEAPYGPPRRYLVEQENLPPPATALSIPQEPTRVLEWGISLAQALDYLHSQHITLGEKELDCLNHVFVTGKQAGWVHLGGVHIAPPAGQRTADTAMAKASIEDVQGLATGLLYLATGHHRARGIKRALAQLPEPAAKALKQGLSKQTKLSAAAFATALEGALRELRHPEAITLIVGQRTDVGRQRSLNEDNLLSMDIASALSSTGADIGRASVAAGLFCVADGMGGHEAGEVASHLAIQAITQQATSEALHAATGAGEEQGELQFNAHQWLATTVATANQAVYEQRKIAGTDMGTTLVIALVIGNTATIANVGDSRAYLIDKDKIIQVTTDHSLVERLVATGQITPEEAINHPQKNVIYRVIGDKPQVKADLFEQQMAPDQALLLCSDGLSGMVPDEQIWRIWRTSTSPQDACDRLVEAANQAGGEDNVTTVIVQMKG